MSLTSYRTAPPRDKRENMTKETMTRKEFPS
jgi:hypothetical protein